MKRPYTIVAIMSFMLLACGTPATPTSTPASTPDVEATVEARVQQRLAENPTGIPALATTPTPEPTLPPTPTQLPTATPTPTLAPTPTLTPFPTVTSTPLPTSTPTPQPFYTYTHPAGLWEITYPGGWQLNGPMTTIGGEEVLINRNPAESLSYFATLRVNRYVNYGQTYDLESWATSVLRLLSERDSFRLISTQLVSVGGYQSYEITYSYAIDTFDYAQVELLMVLGNDAYSISGVVGQGRWDDAKAILQHVVYSFRPLTASATTTTPTSTPAPYLPPSVSSCSPAIESRIDGSFEGWDGETIFPLTNGQIWQQTEYSYTYRYRFMPRVTIFSTVSGCKMQVEGVDRTIRVQRLK